jgi:hypothetical protein
MQLKVSHKIEIIDGSKPGTLAAVSVLMDGSGTELERGDAIQLEKGVTLEAGPISVQVESPFKFQAGGGAVVAPPGGSPAPAAGKPVTTVPAPRR